MPTNSELNTCTPIAPNLAYSILLDELGLWARGCSDLDPPPLLALS